MTGGKINVVVGTKKSIKVSVDETAGLINTDKNSVVIKSTGNMGGKFANGQSITVNNFAITGQFTANGSNGHPRYFLKTNGQHTYWSYGADFITGDYGDLNHLYDALGVSLMEHFDCNDEGPLLVVDLQADA